MIVKRKGEEKRTMKLKERERQREKRDSKKGGKAGQIRRNQEYQTYYHLLAIVRKLSVS